MRALILRQARAWEARDPDAVAADFAPDGVLVSPGGSWRGPEAIREAARKFFEGTAAVEVVVTRVLVDGDAGAVEWTWTETAPDGRRFRAEDGIVFELRDGKIVYWREYFDPAELREPLEEA